MTEGWDRRFRFQTIQTKIKHSSIAKTSKLDGIDHWVGKESNRGNNLGRERVGMGVVIREGNKSVVEVKSHTGTHCASQQSQ